MKERELFKELIIQLQNHTDEQSKQSEKLCFDILNCIFMMQNTEKQAYGENMKVEI